jgi:uncharacterized protein YjbI with pentapeptide repeats
MPRSVRRSREGPYPAIGRINFSPRVQSQLGLRLLPPDLISKARDDTAAQVSRILYTFVGTAAFCLLSLWNPDSALLGGNEKINVPFAGPVSLFGFILLGPAVLIVLRTYLQIYVEHSDRLDRIARRKAIVRTPTLAPLKNPLIRYFSGIAFYLLLPGAMLLFTWKAAVFPSWGSGLLGVAVGVIASHVILLLRKVSWRLNVLLSASVAVLVGVAAFNLGVRRPFCLDHANLSGQSLVRQDLMGADLRDARLVGTELSVANLNDADLTGANLSGARLNSARLSARLNQADLTHAHLTRANLGGASLVHATLSATDLSHTDLAGANLTSANLYNADLTGANLGGANLEDAYLGEAHLDGQAQLDVACGTPRVLPPGLTVPRKCT